jgi:uncharacterized oxidoreductase
MRMTHNTILITGGGSGIGRGLAEAFHKLDNQVVIAGRDQKKLDEVATANPGMRSLTVDMANTNSVLSFAAKITSEFPSLNVAILNAGIKRSENILNQKKPLSEVDETIATNLAGPIHLIADLLPALQKQPQAAIMTVSSGLAFVPVAIWPTYCATKAAIHSYTQSLRYQLKDTSIQVIELIPPYMQTNLGGPRQANDPHAMPPDTYIAEVMEILKNHPDTTEITVKSVYPLRFAADNGRAKYEGTFKSRNDAQMAAVRWWH